MLSNAPSATAHNLTRRITGYFAGRRTSAANPFGGYRFLRTVSAGVLVCFTSVTMSPAIAAIRADSAKREREAATASTITAIEQYALDLTRLDAALAGDKLGSTLGAAKVKVKLTEPSTWFTNDDTADSPQARLAGVSPARILEQLMNAEAAINAEFAATEAHLYKHNLAPTILQRHADTVAAFRAKHAELKHIARATPGQNGQQAQQTQLAQQLATFLKANRAPTTPKDFKTMPWRTHAAKARAPIEDAATLRKTIEATTTPKSTSLTATPDAADLAATIDAQLTPAIRAKAAELNNHPLTIYHWVRNTIRFHPSYGSVQGAQDTLDKLSGNAADTASLLIALYRAANIPARYVVGTIDIPANQVMNWVGGVTNADAAQQILLQGGIPNVALTSGGQITKFRIEHIWVEAWLNYYPSRGAKHSPYASLTDAQTKGTQWVPLDASFKQTQTTQGMDLKNGVAFDANAFLTQAQQGATVNQTEGWVQNLNQTNIQNQLTTYQNQLQAYVNAQKPNATVGDVLGTETIIVQSLPFLPGTLPYQQVTAAATTPRYAALPDNLRHQFQYKLYADVYSRNIDNPTFSYQQSLPTLAGKKITLAYTPATQADADLIASYLPQPNADGSPINPNQFPSQIPAYAKVKAQLRVEGEIVAEGGNFTLGQQLAGRGGFTSYNLADWDLTNDETLIAGQASALGLSIQGISAAQLTTLKTRMQQTQATLQALQGQTNPTIPESLNGDTLTGDILTATIWGYYAALQSHGELSKRQAGTSGMFDKPGLSYGLFNAKVQPIKSFGILTTAVKFPGVEMDIGHLRHQRWAKNNSQADWVTYNRIRGQYASALEHATPERFFIDQTTCNAPTATPTSTPAYDPAKPACAEGVSAVKAIATAQARGQKVYTVTSTNLSAVLPQLSSHSASTKADIQNAINAGKEVTIHEARLTISGWTGAGYVIVDPQTGSGSYLIEGGANGGVFVLTLLTVALIFLTGGVGLLFWVGAGASFVASVLLGLSVSDSENALFGVAAARYLAAILMAVALVVISGFIAVPLAFFAFLALTMSTLAAAFLILIFAKAKPNRYEEFV